MPGPTFRRGRRCPVLDRRARFTWVTVNRLRRRIRHPSGVIRAVGESWPPGGHAIEISGRRAHPTPYPSEQAERSGPDLLCARDLSAACGCVEVEEKLTKTRIGVSQLPLDVAEGPPPQLAPDHHDVRERAGLSVGVAVIETSRAVASQNPHSSPFNSLAPRSHPILAVEASPKGGERAESLLAGRGPAHGATDGRQVLAAGSRRGQRSVAIRPVGPGRLLSDRRPGAGRWSP